MLFAGELYAGSCWAGDVTPPAFYSGLLELESSANRKPGIKVMIAWGGNWTRAMDKTGSLLASITSSSEFSASFPDDRVIDSIRPHKDPVDLTWNGYWKASDATIPQWLLIDMGVARTVNRIILYHYYDVAHCLEDFKIQSSDDGINFITREIVVNNNASKTIIEWDNSVTARYWRLYIDVVANDEIAKVQEIEFYNYIDESLRIQCTPDGVPIYSINEAISADVNSLPEPKSFSITMKNEDNRFSPYNENSPIYGTKQLDNVGEIRSGTPIIIAGGFYNSSNVLLLVEMLSGQIGSEDNPAASTGIAINTSSRTVNLTGKDFSNKIKTTDVPKGLQVYEGNDIDELILELGYLANIPYQDMQIETTGITIPYAIIPEGNVADVMEQIRGSVNGKLFTSYNETLKFITTIPFRSWLQSEQAEFQLGQYNTDDIDLTTEAGKILQNGIDTQAKMNAGTKVDVTVGGGIVYLDRINYQTLESQTAEYLQDTISGAEHIAQGFSVQSPLEVQRIKLKLAYFYGAPTGGSVTVYIKTNKNTMAGARPDAIISTITVPFTSIPAAMAFVDFTIAAPIILPVGQTYWIDIVSNLTGGSYLGVRYNNGGYTKGIWAYSTDGGINYSVNNNKDLVFYVQGQLYLTTGNIITTTIDYGLVPSTQGNLTAQVTVPVGCTIEFLAETLIADAGWGAYVSLGFAIAGQTNFTALLSGIGTAKQYLRIKAILNADVDRFYAPTLHSLYYGSELISQEHDFTVNLIQWGILTANYANGTNIKYKLHTYTVSGTAYDDAQAIEIPIGSQITNPLRRYGKLKVILNRTDYSLAPELWDFTINWLVVSGLTRNQVFQFDFTGANKKTKDINYQIGNPRCNYAKVRINPYILIAIAQVWEHPELPITLANGQSITFDAFYSYPSIRNTAGNIRKVNLTISASSGICNDGSTAVINGCNIAFNSGANIGTITITNASGGARIITALTISATELHDAIAEGRKVQVESIDNTSVTFYGNKKFEKTIDNIFIPTLQYGQNLADALVLWDRYSKGYASGLNVPFTPNLTLQDIISITHRHIPVAGRQMLPTSITKSGFDTSVQCIESLA